MGPESSQSPYHMVNNHHIPRQNIQAKRITPQHAALGREYPLMHVTELDGCSLGCKGPDYIRSPRDRTVLCNRYERARKGLYFSPGHGDE